MDKPLFTNDAIVLGILLSVLAFVFTTAKSEKLFWKKFYTFVPTLLLCYFIPSLLNTFGIINGDSSKLYFVASRYLLPSSLVLLTISIDLPEIKKLGSKAIIMFLAGSVGIIIGGPLSVLLISFIFPEIIGGTGPDAVWRGLTTVAGSWIGGGANQAAMKEVFNVGDTIFSSMIAVDVIIANIWMAFLLYGAGISEKIDNWLPRRDRPRCPSPIPRSPEPSPAARQLYPVRSFLIGLRCDLTTLGRPPGPNRWI